MAPAVSRAAESQRDATEVRPATASTRRRRDVGLEIREEDRRDYEATAILADAGFGLPAGSFRPDVLRWLYETAFSDGTTVLSAWSDGAKVGHIALVHHTISVAGGREPAIALMDLFILKAFRSVAAITALYGAVEAFCHRGGIRFILAVPNGNAAGVNARFLKLSAAAKLEIRVGLAGLPRPWHRVTSQDVTDLDPTRASDMLDRYCGGEGDGLLWMGGRLWARLQKPGARYAVHAGRDALLVSAPRRRGRMDHTMVCGLFVRPGARVSRGAVAALVSAACRHHRRPVFVYAGINGALPLPGLLLPERLRPSPMVLQLRDLRPEGPGLSLSRFEPLDFDFA